MWSWFWVDLFLCRCPFVLALQSSNKKRDVKTEQTLTHTANVQRYKIVMTTINLSVEIFQVEFSRVKRSLRRVNRIGRMQPSQSHIIPLAMQKLLDSPGLETVLQAMAFYRQSRMSQIGCDPKKFGKVSDDNAWLKIWMKNGNMSARANKVPKRSGLPGASARPGVFVFFPAWLWFVFGVCLLALRGFCSPGGVFRFLFWRFCPICFASLPVGDCGWFWSFDAGRCCRRSSFDALWLLPALGCLSCGGCVWCLLFGALGFLGLLPALGCSSSSLLGCGLCSVFVFWRSGASARPGMPFVFFCFGGSAPFVLFLFPLAAAVDFCPLMLVAVVDALWLLPALGMSFVFLFWWFCPMCFVSLPVGGCGWFLSFDAGCWYNWYIEYRQYI